VRIAPLAGLHAFVFRISPRTANVLTKRLWSLRAQVTVRAAGGKSPEARSRKEIRSIRSAWMVARTPWVAEHVHFLFTLGDVHPLRLATSRAEYRKQVEQDPVLAVLRIAAEFDV
jgi:hypothetical protein